MLKLTGISTPLSSFSYNLQITAQTIDVQINFQSHPRYRQVNFTLNTDVRWSSLQSLYNQIDYLLTIAKSYAKIEFKYDAPRVYLNCVVPARTNPYPNNQTTGPSLQFTARNYKIT